MCFRCCSIDWHIDTLHSDLSAGDGDGRSARLAARLLGPENKTEPAVICIERRRSSGRHKLSSISRVSRRRLKQEQRQVSQRHAVGLSARRRSASPRRYRLNSRRLPRGGQLALAAYLRGWFLICTLVSLFSMTSLPVGGKFGKVFAVVTRF